MITWTRLLLVPVSCLLGSVGRQYDLGSIPHRADEKKHEAVPRFHRREKKKIQISRSGHKIIEVMQKMFKKKTKQNRLLSLNHLMTQMCWSMHLLECA